MLCRHGLCFAASVYTEEGPMLPEAPTLTTCRPVVLSFHSSLSSFHLMLGRGHTGLLNEQLTIGKTQVESRLAIPCFCALGQNLCPWIYCCCHYYSVWVCACECRHTWRSEVLDSPGAGVVSHPTWVLGNKLELLSAKPSLQSPGLGILYKNWDSHLLES